MTQEQHKLARSHNLALCDPNRPEKGWRLIPAAGSGRVVHPECSSGRSRFRQVIELPTRGRLSLVLPAVLLIAAVVAVGSASAVPKTVNGTVGPA
jgi:hypothetical protein